MFFMLIDKQEGASFTDGIIGLSPDFVNTTISYTKQLYDSGAIKN